MANRDKHRRAYQAQKSRAKYKGVGFELTFEEWWDWWQATGHYHERGKAHGQYVMSRIGDIGPYTLTNIFCQTFGDNVKQAHCGKIISDETRQRQIIANRKIALNRKLKRLQGDQ